MEFMNIAMFIENYCKALATEAKLVGRTNDNNGLKLSRPARV